MAKVAVVDNGSGVSDEDIERIWEPYARGQRLTPTTTDSIGLGLAVSRQLAVLMNGSLDYRREQDPTLFELTLPTRP